LLLPLYGVFLLYTHKDGRASEFLENIFSLGRYQIPFDLILIFQMAFLILEKLVTRIGMQKVHPY
jgi:hypothetical protein